MPKEIKTDFVELQILTYNSTIENLECLRAFLKGMLKQSPDNFIEFHEKELGQVIYYIKQIKKEMEKQNVNNNINQR